MFARRVRRRGPQLGACLSTAVNDEVKARLRTLLRETAQPVAVVTSLMPSSSKGASVYHGATLSSFSSIAMDPYPLVAFSLRIPSRMAASLRGAHPELPSHMVVNILSAAQASTAVVFSRADLNPRPFDHVRYTLSDDGIPVLEQALGALSCKLASPPIALDDPAFSPSSGSSGVEFNDSLTTSELFIARVTKVESLASERVDADHPQAMPLLYHRRDYSSCSTDSLLPDPKT